MADLVCLKGQLVNDAEISSDKAVAIKLRTRQSGKIAGVSGHRVMVEITAMKQAGDPLPYKACGLITDLLSLLAAALT
jgi:hypothetical protein